jgi:hypothetical protein
MRKIAQQRGRSVEVVLGRAGREGAGMSIDYEKLRARLVMAFDSARVVYEADKGRPSEAFDSGRYDGLKEALQILDNIADGR